MVINSTLFIIRDARYAARGRETCERPEDIFHIAGNDFHIDV
jgi:hypothetical protein